MVIAVHTVGPSYVLWLACCGGAGKPHACGKLLEVRTGWLVSHGSVQNLHVAMGCANHRLKRSHTGIYISPDVCLLAHLPRIFLPAAKYMWAERNILLQVLE